MSGRRSELETEIQRRIQVEIGSEPDLLLMRNSVGEAKHADEETGKVWQFPYGLGVGSPDLVGLLRRKLRYRADGWPVVTRQSDDTVFSLSNPVITSTWFCLEVKCPGETPTDEQKKCHAVWRKFGAFIDVVTSPQEARAALERARKWTGIAP